MKVRQLFEEQPLLASMLEKLLNKGYTVKVDAHGAPFQTGSDRTGWEWRRSPTQGAVEEYDGIWVDYLRLTRDENFTYGQEKRPNSQFLFTMMAPVDRHYTIRKVNDIWTIVDRGEVKKREPFEPLKKPVTESQDHEEFMLKMAMKKMRAEGLDTSFNATPDGVLYLSTHTAAFTINTYFDPRQEGKKWFNAWFQKPAGVRTSPIVNLASVTDVIKDIK